MSGDGTAGAAADWHAADRLFADLLELPEAEREQALQQRAAGNPALLAAVSRLLEAERRSGAAFDAGADALGELLEQALTEPGETGEDVEVPEQIRRLGPYRLLRLLGRGGMSSVWLAERADGEFQRLVAIKLLRQWIDGAEAAGRFVAERQILSSLSHPNIAALLDGGTTADGTPWLAMEYIEGETLTSYCRSRQLSIEARLDLFIQVADAVHHAHRKLVVHRDIKPGNVLVDADGRVKLLDFGIAKLLEPDGVPGGAPMTRTSYRPMTPEYAAPEQLSGEPVSTATDVYQLGVLLYELLCDQRPARAPTDGAGEAPTRPPSQIVGTRGRAMAGGGDESPGSAALARRLRGDLDLIVLKALKREPEQRYSSAAALAEDLRNHLRGRAISIRPESGLEAARRYFRRRPWAAVALVLAVGLAVTAQVSAVRFSQQRDAAQREAQRVAQVRDLMVGLFRQADPVSGENIRGRDTTIWDSVDAATRRIRQELHADPRLRAEMLATLGTLQHYAGHMAEGVELLAEAAALHRELDGPGSAPYAVALAELGRQRSKVGELEEADAAVQEAMRIAATLPRGAEDARIAVLLDAAEVLETLGRLQDSERAYRAALELASAGPEMLSARIAAANGLGQVLDTLGQTADAATLTEQTIALIEQELGPDSVRLVVPLATLGRIQRLGGEPGAAVRNLQRALELQRAAFGDAHESTQGMRNNLALALAADGRHDEAVTEMRILAEQRRPTDGQGRHQYAGNLQNLAVLLVLADRQDEALEVLDEARSELMLAYPQGHFRQAFPLMTQAFIRLRRGEPTLAEPLAREALEILSVQLPAGHHVLGIARCLVGEAMLATGPSEEAAAILAEALPLAQQGPRNMLPYVDNCERSLAAVSPRPPAGT